jgi:hypothetical protein
MQTRDFCFWLQGLFEVAKPETLSKEQVDLIRVHLDLVFQHDAGIKKAEMAHPLPAAPAQVPPPSAGSPDWRYLQHTSAGKPDNIIAYC